MKTLIVDLNVYHNGHHITYVDSIVEYSAGREDILFLFNGKTAEYLPWLHRDARVHFIDENLVHKEEKNVARGRRREYNLIKEFARYHQVQRVIFLEIDQYQLAIGLTRSDFKVTGIYFRPYHMIRVFSPSLVRSLKNAIYHIKKRAMFRILRLNPNVEPLFLLNDLPASRRYPRYFRYLPDPIFISDQPKAAPGQRIRERFNIPSSSHVFLIFGAISDRKNIDNIVAAYREARLDRPSVLLIVGAIKEDYKEEFARLTGEFIRDNKDPRKNIVSLDEFVDEDEIDAYFRESDTIILCYKKFYGSSGLMGKAALHDKTCIVSTEGLLYHLGKQYSLGYAADPLDPHSIAAALTRSLDEPAPSTGRRQFVKDHSEQSFIRTILQEQTTPARSTAQPAVQSVS